MKEIIILLSTVASAIIYRLGGASTSDWKEEYPWIPIALQKIPKLRSLFVNLIAVSILAMLTSAPWWMYLICYALGFLTLLTYHDTKPYNWMKPNDNFWLHGFINGLSFLPLAIINPSLLLPLALRAVVMGLFMGVWCHWLWDIDYIEEWGRGAIVILSLSLLL